MYLLEIIIKSAVQRPRPSDTRRLIEATGYAMPSGHAMRSFASAFYLQKKLPYKWLIWVLAFLISLSRIFTGAHYPSDVLVGALIGLVSGFFWTRWERKI
jgi:undecaprenyl-diphosphatase